MSLLRFGRPERTGRASKRRVDAKRPADFGLLGVRSHAWAAFPGDPPPSWDWFAWFALAPLFALVQSRKPAWSLYLSSWAGGLIFWLLALNWIREVDPAAWLGWVCMATFLSFWWPGFLWIARVAHRGRMCRCSSPRRSRGWGLSMLAHILSGFPWYYLAHTQYRNLAIIQVSDLARGA